MNHKHRIAIALAACLALTGCLEPSPEETTPKSAKELVDAMVYVKAKNGLCFGVATTTRWSTNGTAAAANIVVEVACEKVGL